MDRKVNCRVIISIILCMTLITGIVFPCNVYAAKKVIGLVSEQEYLNKYTKKILRQYLTTDMQQGQRKLQQAGIHHCQAGLRQEKN